MELLEKRVRSRFSHRKQLIPEMEEKDFGNPGNSPKDVLAAMLTMPDSDSSTAQTCDPVQQWNSAVSQILGTDAVAHQLKLMMNQGSDVLLAPAHLRCLSCGRAASLSEARQPVASAICRRQLVAWQTSQFHYHMELIKIVSTHTLFTYTCKGISPSKGINSSKGIKRSKGIDTNPMQGTSAHCFCLCLQGMALPGTWQMWLLMLSCPWMDSVGCYNSQLC